MPLTSPDSIDYPAVGYPDGFVDAMAAMATSIQAALTLRERHSYVWANSSERGAQAGMVTGELGIQTDTAIVYRYNGSAWKAWESDWATYTSTLTNFAVGTGGSAATSTKWRYENGLIHVKNSWVLGSSGASVTGVPTFTLPVSAEALVSGVTVYLGVATLRDEGTNSYIASVTSGSLDVTTGRVIMIGTLGVATNISNVSPFTWASTDKILVDFSYSPA